MNEPDIDAIIRGGGSRRRWLLISGVTVAAIIVAVVAVVLTRSDSEEIAVEPERAEAVMGRLTTEAELSGSAVSERSATLTFEVAGVVATVEVVKGDDARAGDVMAALDDTDARRHIATSEVQLRQAQLRLDNLLADPDASAVASANQAIVSAKSQVMSAELELERLLDPPSAADLASAEQAVSSSLAQLSTVEQALAMLSEPPSAADMASAEQAVATALGQISSAEQALEQLSEPPGTADLASAEQAVATAAGQVSTAEEALADLLAEPSEAEIAESRSAVTQAEVQLADATRLEEESDEALTEAFDAFCERYDGLIPSDDVISSICTGTLPLSEVKTDDLQESYEDRSETYESLGTSLTDANVAYIAAAADRESALSALTSARESLTELLQPASEDDVFQAEQALEAARSSYATAVARLEDLQETATEEDIYQAQQTLEAARSSHAAAVARLGDLQEAATEDDVYQAEREVEAARLSHAAAVARLDELRSAVDEGDLDQARASLESAQASLVAAQTQYDDLLAGPSENEIEQQRQDVRLAELSLEEAREALVGLTIVAPFDGTVEAVNIQPGDTVTASLAAFTLSTSDRMLIELTVTEEELLDMEVGQTGVATFDAIDGIEYPVRVESIGRVPNAEQGVVTYDVEARILTGPQLDGAGTRDAVGGFRPGGGFGGGFGGSAPGGPMAGLELPEGVTIQQVFQAIAAGQPLPEGVVLPEGIGEEELQAMTQAIRRFAGGGQGAGGQQATADGQPGRDAARPLPAPGMSASVTILTEIREEAVLLPVSAVRQLDGRWFVSVPSPGGDEAGPGFERVFVEVGESDGEVIEIASGLDAGMVVLIGADSEGIAFIATQRQPQAPPGFDFGPGGGGRR